jgi:VWFA-related protein
MTPARVITGLAVVAVASAPVLTQGPTFRGGTNIVPVYVAVRAGQSIVGGLGASDFKLTDRGIEQKIEIVSAEAVPIDVTLVVDTSQSVTSNLPAFRSDVRTIVGMLKPAEQIRLMTFDTEVRQVLSMQAPSGRPPVNEIRLGDTTALVDAMTFALARERRTERRHLVFVFTDGVDTSSVLDYASLPEIVARTDALLHIALVRPAPPTVLPPAALAALSSAASRTGGSLYPPGHDEGIVAAFDRAINDFRASYVLYFTPTDVPGAGWHDIKVQLQRQGNYDVKARAGYFAREN